MIVEVCRKDRQDKNAFRTIHETFRFIPMQ